MKEIFQGKTFWAILITLLLVTFIYPPFIFKQGESGIVAKREWGWISSPPQYSTYPTHYPMEIDFKTLFAEAIIVILLTIGICLVPFKKIGLVIKSVHINRYVKWTLEVILIVVLIRILAVVSKHYFGDIRLVIIISFLAFVMLIVNWFMTQWRGRR